MRLTAVDEESGMITAQRRIAYTPNMPLSELSAPEIFVVSSVRLWMLPHCCPSMEYPDWRAGFARAGISCAGALGFNTFCWILATSTSEPLQVRALHCTHLGEHEAWLLEIVSLLQSNKRSPAEVLLARRCARSGARLALAPIEAFANALASQRLWLAFRFDLPEVLTNSRQRERVPLVETGSAMIH
jgi:hypothetical protein